AASSALEYESPAATCQICGYSAGTASRLKGRYWASVRSSSGPDWRSSPPRSEKLKKGISASWNKKRTLQHTVSELLSRPCVGIVGMAQPNYGAGLLRRVQDRRPGRCFGCGLTSPAAAR